MLDHDALCACGIDGRAGVERCMNDEALYTQVLTLFLDDDSMERARAALAKDDRQALFRCMHELRGACGNAEMTRLYQAVGPLVERLRAGGGTRGELEVLLLPVEAAYRQAMNGIAALCGRNRQ